MPASCRFSAFGARQPASSLSAHGIIDTPGSKQGGIFLRKDHYIIKFAHFWPVL